MKMIDEKGKLFGKLNIIDLLVIVVIIAALVLVGVKVAGKGGGGGGGGTKITYTVKVSAVSRAVYDSIKTYLPGDQLMANGALLDAYVTDVKAADHKANATISTMDGSSLVIPVDPDTLDLTFTIEANIVNTTTQEVGTQEVRVGKKHIVKTVNFELMDGIIESIAVSTGAEG